MRARAFTVNETPTMLRVSRLRRSNSSQLVYEKMKHTVADKSYESHCFVSSSDSSSSDMNISNSPAVASPFDSFLLQSAIDCGVTAHGDDAMTPEGPLPFSLNTSSIAVEDSFGSDEPPRTDHVKELLARLNAKLADESYDSKMADSRPFQLSQVITSPTNRVCVDDMVRMEPNVKSSDAEDTPRITNQQSMKGPNFSAVVSPVSKQEHTDHSLIVEGDWSFDEKLKSSIADGETKWHSTSSTGMDGFDLDFKDSTQWVAFEPFEEFIHPTKHIASTHNEVSLELKEMNARLASIELFLRNVIQSSPKDTSLFHIDDDANDERTCTPVKNANQPKSLYFGRFFQKKSHLREV